MSTRKFPVVRRRRYAIEGGQRQLTGADVEADFQEYHAAHLRLSNSQLTGPAVVEGLSVAGETGSGKVTVSPGVAIDAGGRPVVLSSPPSNPSELNSYAHIGEVSDGNSVQPAERVEVPVEIPLAGAAGTAAFVVIEHYEGIVDDGTPYDIKELQPWLRLRPIDECDEDAIVLALVEVDNGGKLVTLSIGNGSFLRRYVGQNLGELTIRQVGKVSQVVSELSDPAGVLRPTETGGLAIVAETLELPEQTAAILRNRHYHGIADVDANMPLAITLYFESELHVPQRIKLALRGLRFSRAFYTELGGHTHSASSSAEDLKHDHAHNIKVTGDGSHSHFIRTGNAGGAGKPGDHGWNGNADNNNNILAGWQGGWVSLLGAASGETGKYRVSSEGHSHGVSGGIKNSLSTHSHGISISQTGANVSAAGELKEFLKDLHVVIGGQDKTAKILERLTGWTGLGDGTGQHALCKHGTGVVDITDLIPRAIGSHEIAFQVASGGGKLVYDVFCS